MQKKKVRDASTLLKCQLLGHLDSDADFGGRRDESELLPPLGVKVAVAFV